MLVRDIMVRNVVTVAPDTPVPEVARLMVAHRISGLPVVDNAGRVVGIVTEGDLCRRVETGTGRRRTRWLDLLTGAEALAADDVCEHGGTAAEVMSPDVVHVGPETPIAEVADLFEAWRIKRVPVIEAGRLVGIVSRANLVQAIAAYRPSPPSTEEVDRRIRDDLLRAYAREPWGLRSDSNIVVHDGVVHLWGLVNSGTECQALRIAAEAIPGVKGVKDHTVPVEGSWPALL